MKTKIVLYLVILILGIFLGWLFFHAPHSSNEKHDQVAEA